MFKTSSFRQNLKSARLSQTYGQLSNTDLKFSLKPPSCLRGQGIAAARSQTVLTGLPLPYVIKKKNLLYEVQNYEMICLYNFFSYHEVLEFKKNAS